MFLAAAAWRFAFFRAALEIRFDDDDEDVDVEVVILETKAECLMSFLSRFVSRKVSDTTESGRWTLRGASGLARRSAALRRRVLRLVEEGAVGAFWWGVGCQC